MPFSNFHFRLLAAVFSVLLSSAASADFVSRFEAEKTALSSRGYVSKLSETLANNLSEFDFVLVDGILGDLTQDLYTPALAYLRAQVPSSNVQVLRPSSWKGLSENAELIALELSRGTRSKIVLAHSRGAAEVFIALLKNPQLLIEGKVAKVVLVQGAFSGSPLAEWVDQVISKGCKRATFSIADQSCAFIEKHSESLKALVPLEARKIRKELQDSYTTEERKFFQEKISFVRSRSRLSKTHFPLMPSALYLKKYYSAFENDGILLTMQQRVPHFGTDLGVVTSDHLSLLGNVKPLESQAFVKALLEELFLE